MNEDQRRELLLLADGLEKVPRERFDMGVWGRGSLVYDGVGSACAFAGCAIGWAPRLIPNCGLQIVEYQSGQSSAPRFDGRWGMYAVARYFGLSLGKVEYLFDPSSYVGFRAGREPSPPSQYRTMIASISPATVAHRIRSFLALD